MILGKVCPVVVGAAEGSQPPDLKDPSSRRPPRESAQHRICKWILNNETFYEVTEIILTTLLVWLASGP